MSSSRPEEEDPVTTEHRIRQARKEADEREELEHASSDEEADQHARRADKAAYLREKLEQRAESERDAD